MIEGMAGCRHGAIDVGLLSVCDAQIHTLRRTCNHLDLRAGRWGLAHLPQMKKRSGYRIGALPGNVMNAADILTPGLDVIFPPAKHSGAAACSDIFGIALCRTAPVIFQQCVTARLGRRLEPRGHRPRFRHYYGSI